MSVGGGDGVTFSYGACERGGTINEDRRKVLLGIRT